MGRLNCLEDRANRLVFHATTTGMPTGIPVFSLAVGLTAGHEALDFVIVVRIHDRQLAGLILAVGLAAGHEALDFVGVVRIHDRHLASLIMAVGLAAGHEALNLVGVVRIHDRQLFSGRQAVPGSASLPQHRPANLFSEITGTPASRKNIWPIWKPNGSTPIPSPPPSSRTGSRWHSRASRPAGPPPSARSSLPGAGRTSFEPIPAGRCAGHARGAHLRAGYSAVVNDQKTGWARLVRAHPAQHLTLASAFSSHPPASEWLEFNPTRPDLRRS